MKRLITVSAVILVLFAFNLCGFSAPQDIVYVDLFEAFSKYKKTNEYDKTLEEKQTKKEEELAKEKEEIDKLQEELKLLKEDKQESKKAEIEKKAGEFDNERRQAFLDLKKERDEKMQEILKDIDKVIEKYARQNKVLVLKKAAVAYGDKSLDKTEEIIKLLNAK